MRGLLRWLGRLLATVLVFVLILLAPVGYIEFACRGDVSEAGGARILQDPAWHRDESRTLTTYPEWHIVHAYDDYARVIRKGDPHEFAFLRAVAGFWTSLCPLKARADAMGGMTTDSKLTIYTIGLSFSVEMLAKALYEETLGRFTAWVRGDARTPLDEVSAEQATRYAAFLQQTPWYEWDFGADLMELRLAATDVPRDRERVLALGVEYTVKSGYAGLIEDAVAGIGPDELRLRSIVTGLSADRLVRIEGVDVISVREEGVEIETDRYRAFTGTAERLAQAGADFVEIAGNDEILFTALSDTPEADGALHSFRRQGYGDWRHLILVPVTELADRLREPAELRLEHVHDY